MRLTHGNALQNSVFVGGGGGALAFDATVSSRAFTFGGLSGGGNQSLLNTASNAVALTVNQAEDTTYSGVMSGAGASFIKSGDGALTLIKANTYTGGTTVTGGTLVLDFSADGAAANNILSSSGSVTLNGGTLRIVGPSANPAGTLQTFSGLASGTGTSTLRLVQTGSGVFDVDVGALSFGAGTLNFTGLTGTEAGARVITSTNAGANDGSTQLAATAALWEGDGWASVTQVGGVNYVVRWTGSYTDLTTDGNAANPTGNLRILNGGGTGTATTYDTNRIIDSLIMVADQHAAAVAMDSGSILTVGAGATGNVAIATTGRSLMIGGTVGQGTVTAGDGGAATLNLANANVASTLTINANIADNGVGPVSVSTAGAGAVILNGGLSYTGSTAVGGGADLTVNSRLGGGTYAGDITANGALRLNQSESVTLTGGLSGTGNLIQTGTGTLILAGTNTFQGVTTIDSGSTLQVGDGGSTGTLGPGTVTNNGTLVFNRGDTLIQNAVITGSGAVVQSGTGVTQLTANNTYAGGSTVLQGELQALTDTAAGVRTTFGTGTVTANAGATVRIKTGSTGNAQSYANDFALNDATFISEDGVVTYGGDFALTGTNTVNVVYNAKNAFFTGNVSGTGELIKTGSGALVLAGTANSFSGTTTVTGGTLRLASGGALQNSRFVGGGGGGLVFDASVSTHAFTFGGLSGGGNLSLLDNASTPNAVALTVNQAEDTTYSGVMSGAGSSFTKSGAGTLTLTKANTYTGGTIVNDGSLVLDFSASGATTNNILSSSGAVALNNGTLKIIGKSGQTNLQTFAGLGSTGASTLELVQNGANTLDVNIGALGIGSGTLDFVGLTGSATGARVITTATAGANDSTTQLAAASALWNGSDWASVEQVGGVNYVVKWGGPYADVHTTTDDGKQIVIPNDTTPANVRILENGANTVPNSLAAATTTVGSLLMTAAVSSSTIAMNTKSANDTLIVANGNVAISATGRSLTIGQTAGEGVLTAGTAGAATLSLANNNPASALTINSRITDNAGAVSVAVGGVGPVVFNGTLSYTGSTTVGGGARLTTNAPLGGGAYAGAITNNGTLTLAAGGVQTLSGAVSGAGTLAVQNGTLKIGAASILGSGQQVLVAGGATLDANGLNIGAASVSLMGSGIGGNGALVNGVAGTTSTLGALSLAGSATVSGAGATSVFSTSSLNLAGHTLGLSSVRLNLTGGGMGSDGDISVNNGGVIYISGTASSANVTGTMTLNAGSFLEVNGYNSTSTGAGVQSIVLNGGTIGNGGAYAATSGNGGTQQSSLANAIVVASGGGTLNGNNTSSGLSLDFSGTLSGSGNLTLTGGATAGIRLFGDTSGFTGNIAGTTKLTMAGSGTQWINGVLSGTGTLEITGTGTTVLASANTFTGGATLSSGTLRLEHSNALQSGTLTYTGGTLDFGNLTSVVFGGLAGAAGQSISLENGSAEAVSLTIGSGISTTYGGALVGGGSLTKIGAGTLTLSGNNTYSGGTTVAAGTLTLNYATNDTGKLSDTAMLTLAGGTLTLVGGSTVETVASTTLGAGLSRVNRTSGTAILQMNAITREAGARINFAADGIATTDTRNTNGILGTWATIGGTNGTDWAMNSTNGDDGLITAYTGYTDVTRRSSGSTVIADGAATNVRIIEGGGGATTITLGAATTTINTLNQSNSGGTTAATIAPAGQTLAVNSILVGTGGLTIGATSGDGTLKTATAGGELAIIGNAATTINSVIADNAAASSLTKLGSGVLILTANNTYTGNTTVLQGELQALSTTDGAKTTFGSGTVNVLNTNTILRIKTAAGNVQSYANNFVLNGAIVFTDIGSGAANNGGAVTYGGDFALTGTNTFSVSVSGTSVTINGAISGTGGFTKTGSGTLILSGANNTYSGATTVSGGTLSAGATNAFGANSGLSSGGGGVFLNNFNQTIGSLAGGGNVTLGGATLTLGNNNANTSYTGVISGTGGLTKIGSGTQTFTKAQTYTGLTTVSDGVLALDYAAAAGSNIIASGNDLLLSGGTVRFDNLGSAKTQTFGTTTLAAGTGSTLLRGSGWISGVAVNLGTLAVNGGGAALEVSDITTAPSWIRASGNLSQSILLAGAVTTSNGTKMVATDGSGNFILATSADYANNATISGGPGTNVRLIAAGSEGDGATASGFTGLTTAGTTDFATLLNAYSGGATTVDITNNGANPGNILRMGASGAIVAAAGSDLVLGASVANGGTLTAGGAANTAGTLAFNATNHITVNAAVADNGFGLVSLTKNGAGTLRLAGVNTYTGDTAVAEGTLVVGTAGQLGSGNYAGALNIASGAIFHYDSTANQTMSGAVGGAGSLTKSNTGTLKLDGANSYTGGTTINAGTLIAGHDSAFGAGIIAVSSGGTLNTGLAGAGMTLANTIALSSGSKVMGAGTLTNSLTVVSGATLAPGNSPGTITLQSGVTFQSGSIYEWEIGGAAPSVAGMDFDLINVTGGVFTVDGGAVLKLSSLGLDYTGAFWTSSHSFTFVTITGGATTGAFVLDTSLAGTFASYGSWSLGMGDNDMTVVWTAVPEPSTYGLLGAGTLAAAALVRRRLRRKV